MKNRFQVDFLGIGPSKAGTTWLGHMLSAHPEICLAEPKEVHFFNDYISHNKLYDGSHFPRGLTWYQKHFTHCDEGKIKGEVTPRYIIDPVVPERIFEHNPDIKLIVCLRSPYKRIVSHYHSAKDYHQSVSGTISEVIREIPEFIDACLYYKNISRYLPYFSLDRFFFVDMEEAINEPKPVLSGLYSFLNVDPMFTPRGMDEKSNPARRTKYVRFRKWSGKIHRSLVAMGLSPLVQLLRQLGIGQLLNQMNSNPVEKVELSEADKKFIKSKIEEDIVAFGKLTGRDFSHWLND
jgi:hypothetical protein